MSQSTSVGQAAPLTTYACAVCLKDLSWGGAVILARATNPAKAAEAVERLFNLLPHADGNPFIVTDAEPLKDLL